MRNGSYLPQPHERASIKWQSSSLLVSELAPLMPLAPPGQGPYFSSLHCLTVHFSARTWKVWRVARAKEVRERRRGVALIHSTVSLGLPVRPTPGRLLPSPLKVVCQNIPCYCVSNISPSVSSSRSRHKTYKRGNIRPTTFLFLPTCRIVILLGNCIPDRRL